MDYCSGFDLEYSELLQNIIPFRLLIISKKTAWRNPAKLSLTNSPNYKKSVPVSPLPSSKPFTLNSARSALKSSTLNSTPNPSANFSLTTKSNSSTPSTTNIYSKFCKLNKIPTKISSSLNFATEATSTNSPKNAKNSLNNKLSSLSKPSSAASPLCTLKTSFIETSNLKIFSSKRANLSSLILALLSILTTKISIKLMQAHRFTWHPNLSRISNFQLALKFLRSESSFMKCFMVKHHGLLNQKKSFLKTCF